MTLLTLAAFAWLLVHIGISGTAARSWLVARIGEGRFVGAFAVASLATLWALVASYKAAPSIALWTLPGWVGWLIVLAMLPACIFLVGSVISPNPTMAGPPKTGTQATAPAGITLVTRHPMLWAFAIWGLVHLLGNGDASSTLFFGTFLVTALAGMPSIDAKLARRDPDRWAAIAATTSIVPGAALLTGRATLAVKDIGWVVPLAGLLLWVLLLGAHPHVIGVSPLPAG